MQGKAYRTFDSLCPCMAPITGAALPNTPMAETVLPVGSTASSFGAESL
jgi:hypothetical protein